MQAKFFKTALLVSVSAGLLTSCDSNNQTPPSERYEYKNNGSVVVDKVNKLEWMRCSLGQTWNQVTSLCEGSSKSIRFDFVEGVAPVINRSQSDINVGGLTDWRMPSIQELRSLRYCSELSENETDYLAEQENINLKKALQSFVKIQTRSLERANAEIKDIEMSRDEEFASNDAEIASLTKQLVALDEKLANDIKNLSAESADDVAAAQTAITELKSLMQKEQDELNATVASYELLIEQNELEEIAQRAKHKGIVSAVETKFKDEIKQLRKLKKDLVGVNAERTTSKIVKMNDELQFVKGVIKFYEQVYGKKEGDISLIAEEVLRKNELVKFIDAESATKAKIKSDLEQEIASLTNAETQNLFESESILRDLKRSYYSNELGFYAKINAANDVFEKLQVQRVEQLRVAGLDRIGRMTAATQIQKDLINAELAIIESGNARELKNSNDNLKATNHNIRKLNNTINRFLEILELESLDDLDQFLAADDITQIAGIAELQDEVLTDFSIYVTKVAELEGSFPGLNDVVREPCGYLGRSPIRRYQKSPEKDNLVNGVWMLDETAFPSPEFTANGKTKLENGDFYWSGSELSYDELYAWGVNFSNGLSYSNQIGYNGRIRLVRNAD